MGLMTISMAAQALGIAPRTVLQHIEHGHIQAEQLPNGMWLMRESEARKLLNRRKPGRPAGPTRRRRKRLTAVSAR